MQGYADVHFTHNPFDNVPTLISAGTLVSDLIRDNPGADDITPINFAQDGFAVGVSQLVAKNGNIGVGTANPAAKLDVRDSQASGNEIGSISIRGAADPTKRLNFGYDEIADYARIQAVKNGSAKRSLFLDVLRLGLGTNAPTSMLGTRPFRRDFKHGRGYIDARVH